MVSKTQTPEMVFYKQPNLNFARDERKGRGCKKNRCKNVLQLFAIIRREKVVRKFVCKSGRYIQNILAK